MRTTALLSILLTTSTYALPISIAEEHFPRPCAPLHVIVARGTCESGVITDHYGEGNFFVIADKITSQVNGANSFGTVYPATGIEDCPAPAYAQSEVTGVQSLKQDIMNYATRCPMSKIALVGYSQGGQIVGDVLCGASEGGAFPVNQRLTRSWGDHVVAAVIFGDPAFAHGQSYSRGTATTSGLVPRTSTAACSNFANKLRSYCNAADPICAKGNDMNAHWSYKETDGDDAVDYVLSMYRAAVN